MNNQREQYIEYYAGLCPFEDSWVHEQLADERESYDKEIAKLKKDVACLQEKYNIVFPALAEINRFAGQSVQQAIDIPDSSEE